MRFLIIQDYKENRQKCTVTPLEGEDGITLVRLGRPPREPREVEVPGGVLLHIDGPPLSRFDGGLLADGQLLLVDSTWARVPKVLERLRTASGARLEKRSLPRGFVTAYPRASKLYKDPLEGLSSVEALFLAALILGKPRPNLLRHYKWSGEFLRRNLAELQAFCPELSSSSFNL